MDSLYKAICGSKSRRKAGLAKLHVVFPQLLLCDSIFLVILEYFLQKGLTSLENYGILFIVNREPNRYIEKKRFG